jgi:hypothetical protein
MTGYSMTDPFGQVRSRVCQLAVMVSVTVIGYMTGSSGHGHASAVMQTKTGPWMKGALDLVMVWQLDNSGSSREDAIEMVKRKRAEILRC